MAHATDKELARYVQFLKAESQALRAKLPKVVTTTPQQRRRLVRLRKPIGPAV